ncbi:MAG: adenylate cyclase, partial [Lachnospiraceae bacterium]|nr:adenylate cyclase [Lachnospiraceae bacterium]
HPTFTSDYEFPVDQISLTIELDIFDAPFENLVIAEVEFPDERMAEAFCPVPWFADDVTNDPAYHNSNLSRKKL